MAYVNLGQVIYPVGSVYMSYTSTSPASIFGGNWTAITGRFPYFNAGISTGGSNSAHNHNFTFTYYPYYAGIGVGWNEQADESLFTFGPTEKTKQSNASDDRYVNSGVAASMTFHKTLMVEKEVTTTNNSHLPAYQTFYAWRRTS